MAAIPASQIVEVIPGVIGAGGSALEMNGLILTANTRVPIGTVATFTDLDAVAEYFGATDQLATLAGIYFLGYDNSTAKPGALKIAQYPWTAPVGAWLRGGDISAMTLTALQALSGSLTVVVDGVTKTTASVSLSAATSFSSAALILQTALSLTPLAGASVTGSIATTVLTVTAVASGTLAVGQTISGTSVTAATTIVAQLTGTTGGVGTYTVSASQTVSSTAITATNPPITYDSQSGGFRLASSTTGPSSTIGYATGTLAASLLLTAATGAVNSQGAAIAVPATFMTTLTAVTRNWGVFMTAFEPSVDDKVAFAAWNNSQGNQYCYAMWTTNAAATIVPDTTTAAVAILAAEYSGVELIYESGSDGDKAAFFLSWAASLDFAATDGRATARFKHQTGITPDVTNGTIADNLTTNGYNYYGQWDTRNDEFKGWADGSITGPFLWADSYINQIWMNNGFQLAEMSLLFAKGSIPYNQAGYNDIRAAALDPINAAVNFGAIRAGVTLSNAQAAQVNTAAGRRIDDVITTLGWYLQILDPTPQVRAARGTPVCNFWYTDGQSVHHIRLASIAIQ